LLYWFTGILPKVMNPGFLTSFGLMFCVFGILYRFIFHSGFI